jgi:cytochrome c oxidase cbb3-type subunit I/II
MFVMIYNLYKTAKQGSFVAEEAAEAPALEKTKDKIRFGLNSQMA